MNIKSTPSLTHNLPIAMVVIALGISIFSCSDDSDDPVVPKLAAVKFNDTSLNIEENSSSALAVNLSLSEALEKAGTVTISIDNGSTATSSDFTTYPEASAETITLSLPEGASSASFSVSPIDNNDVTDDKTIIFTLSSADGGVELASSDLTTTVTVTNDDDESSVNLLLLNENFDYGTTAGDITALSTWEIYSGTENPIQYIVDGLSFDGYANSAVGGAVTFEGGSGSRQDLQRQFDSQNSGTIYFAQIINIGSAVANESGDFFLSLRNAGDSYFVRFYARDNGSGNLLLGTARSRVNGGTTIFSTTEYSYNTDYLVVFKYDFETKGASMFVFSDVVPTTEPTTPDVFADTGEEPSALEEIVIRQGADAIAGTLDGIRIGTTWEEVVGLE